MSAALCLRVMIFVVLFKKNYKRNATCWRHFCTSLWRNVRKLLCSFLPLLSVEEKGPRGVKTSRKVSKSSEVRVQRVCGSVRGCCGPQSVFVRGFFSGEAAGKLQAVWIKWRRRGGEEGAVRGWSGPWLTLRDQIPEPGRDPVRTQRVFSRKTAPRSSVREISSQKLWGGWTGLKSQPRLRLVSRWNSGAWSLFKSGLKRLYIDTKWVSGVLKRV